MSETMHRRFNRLLVMSSLLLITLTCSHVSQAQAQEPITTREMSLSSKKPGVRMTKSLSGTAARLRPHKIVVTDGDTIRGLLESSGIHYDGGSLSMVYDLNPALEDAGEIKKGEEIALPFAVGGNALQRDRANGYLVAIALDKSLKKALLKNCVRLKELGSGFERTGSSDNLAIKPAVKEVLESLEIIKKTVQENVQPLSHDTLSQLTDETDLMIGILGELVSSGKPASDAERAAIDRIKGDLTVKVASFVSSKGPNQVPERERDVRVVVSTLRNDGRQVSSVRIFYMGEALFGNAKYSPKSFSTLDNPSEKKMGEGDYMVWAANAADSSRVSEPVLVNVRKSQIVNGKLGPAFYLDIAVK